MKLLFILTAIFEGLTGIALLIAPATFISLLLGSALDDSVGPLIARVLGAALISIAVVCSRADTGQEQSSLGIVAGLLFYNAVAGALFVYAGLRLEMHSALLWPAILAHSALAIWSLAILYIKMRRRLDE